MMIFFFLTVIGGKSINIIIKITDGKYNESLLSDGFDEEVTTFMCLFTSSTLVKLKITYLCVHNATVQLQSSSRLESSFETLETRFETLEVGKQ